MSDNLKVAKECAQSVSKAIDDYIDSYEFRGDGGDYTPNETEALLITDAIMGLLEDDDFKAAYTARILASQQAAHDAEIARLNALVKELSSQRENCRQYLMSCEDNGVVSGTLEALGCGRNGLGG